MVKPPVTRREVLIGASLLAMPQQARGGWVPQQAGAGFCERLLYHSLANDLRAGRMSTVVNGTVVPGATAERMVAHARGQGWLP